MTRTKRIHFSIIIGISSLILAACSSISSIPASGTVTGEPNISSTETETPKSPTSEPLMTLTPSHDLEDCDDPFLGVRVQFNPAYWDSTNFCIHSIDYADIFSGGPMPDGIPPIDNPVFESMSDAATWLSDNMPIMFFEWNGDARGYPLAIMIWHEIVNDVVGGQPVSLTFCPLCNATIAFNRELPDGTLLDFGTSGNLRNSDLVMYDRQTQSWWQQFTGEAIVGDYTGTILEFLPSQIISWEDFRDTYPDGMVLSRDTGYVRDYGQNPYFGYDEINNSPFLFTGQTDGRLSAMERVVAIGFEDQYYAYPFTSLSQLNVINDVLAELPIGIFWRAGTASALDDSNIDQSRDVGSSAVFLRETNGQILTFEYRGGDFIDTQTNSTWTLFGEAIDGPLSGTKLEQIVSAEHFWFSWAAFRPDTQVWFSP